MIRRVVLTGICTVTLLTLFAGMMPVSGGNKAAPGEHARPLTTDGGMCTDYYHVYINGVMADAELQLWADPNDPPPAYDFFCPGGSAIKTVQAGTYYGIVVGYSKVDGPIAINASGRTFSFYRP